MGEIFILDASHAWIIADKGVNADQATLLKMDIATMAGVTENGNNIVQNEYTLLQNYPNPFNPVTTISYHLASACNVSVPMYNLNGRKIETLLNQYQSAGRHEIQWQPQGLSSGIYFCTLQAGNFSETRKLILQR